LRESNSCLQPSSRISLADIARLLSNESSSVATYNGQREE